MAGCDLADEAIAELLSWRNVASKSGQQEPEKAEVIEEMLDGLDGALDRVKVLYEQYFLGIQKQPPSHLHADIERKTRDLTQMQIRNTALRYRFATLTQKFGSYNSYWRRTLRQIENGTYTRNLSKIGRQAARTGADVPEEILAAMPKRMREQVKRDREAQLALQRRREQPAAEEVDIDVGDLEPAIAGEAPQVVRAAAKNGAHVISEDDGDFDLDAFFARVTTEGEPDPLPIGQPEATKRTRPGSSGHPMPPRAARAPDAVPTEIADGAQTNVIPKIDGPPAQRRAETAGDAVRTMPVPRLDTAQTTLISTMDSGRTIPVPRPVAAVAKIATVKAPAIEARPGGPAIEPPAIPAARPTAKTPAMGMPVVPPARPTGQGPAIEPPAIPAGRPTAKTPAMGTPIPAAKTPAIEPPAIPAGRPTVKTPAMGMPIVPPRPTAKTPALAVDDAAAVKPPPIPAVKPPAFAPSQAARPSPIAPGASTGRTAIPVETMSGPFPRIPSMPPIPTPDAPEAATRPHAAEAAPRPQSAEAAPRPTAPAEAAPREIVDPPSRPTPPPTPPPRQPTQRVPVNADRPQTQRVPVNADRPQTQRVPVTGDRPQTQRVPVTGERPQTQRVPVTGERPQTQRVPVRPASERPEPPPRPPPPPGMSDADVNALYAKYVQAKQILGEDAGPGAYGKLLKTINAQAPKIMEQYKSKGVDFSVVVKDNQVIIRAKPKP